jgi:hypothetical protein
VHEAWVVGVLVVGAIESVVSTVSTKEARVVVIPQYTPVVFALLKHMLADVSTNLAAKATTKFGLFAFRAALTRSVTTTVLLAEQLSVRAMVGNCPIVAGKSQL